MNRVCCGASVFAPRVLKPLLLFVMELSIGERVFYIKSTRLWVPAKVVGFLHDGHVELEFVWIKVVCGSSIIDAPWTPSPSLSPVSSLHHHPHRFPFVALGFNSDHLAWWSQQVASISAHFVTLYPILHLDVGLLPSLWTLGTCSSSCLEEHCSNR